MLPRRNAGMIEFAWFSAVESFRFGWCMEFSGCDGDRSGFGGDGSVCGGDGSVCGRDGSVAIHRVMDVGCCYQRALLDASTSDVCCFSVSQYLMCERKEFQNYWTRGVMFGLVELAVGLESL